MLSCADCGAAPKPGPAGGHRYASSRISERRRAVSRTTIPWSSTSSSPIPSSASPALVHLLTAPYHDGHEMRASSVLALGGTTASCDCCFLSSRFERVQEVRVLDLLVARDGADPIGQETSMTTISLCLPPLSQTMSGRSGTASRPIVGIRWSHLTQPPSGSATRPSV